MAQENVQSDVERMNADSGTQPQPAQGTAKGTPIPPWAIILIVVGAAAMLFLFLVLLFALGMFNSGPLPTLCIARSGFMCTIQSFHAGNLTLTVGQITGSNWNNVSFAFLNTSTLSNQNNSAYYTSRPAGNGSIMSGAEASVVLHVPGVSDAPGTSIQGQLWAEYYTYNSSYSGPYYVEVATLTAQES